MAKVMKIITCICGLLFLICLAWYSATNHGLLLSLSITSGVCTYHFLMRLLVGHTVNAIFHNRMNHRRRWFQPLRFEGRLYEFLKVKQWKKHVPTYDPEAYSPRSHTWEEILMTTCQSEVVHEIIMLLSFLPLLLIVPFGEPPVFIVTSVCAASIDLIFVVLQRYNRPRIRSLVQRLERRHTKR